MVHSIRGSIKKKSCCVSAEGYVLLPLGSNIVAIKQNYEKIFLVFVKVGLFEEKTHFLKLAVVFSSFTWSRSMWRC